jgi:hypothetical protein
MLGMSTKNDANIEEYKIQSLKQKKIHSRFEKQLTLLS